MSEVGNKSNSTQESSSWLLSSPSLSPGRGGGSLKGIDCRFRNNAVTGSAGVSLSLPLSPSRDGSVPSLSLSYDSGYGQGAFGLGWSLDYPQIVRSTTRRLPLYDDCEDTDVFVLNGLDLVCIGEEKRGDILVRHYRLQAENNFIRVEYHRQTSGESNFYVFESDGSILSFGVNEESRIVDPTVNTRIYAYLLHRREDVFGNVFIYRYRTEGANRYLEQILYGNKEPFCSSIESNGYELGVFFEYENRDDVFTDRRPGFALSYALRCCSINLFHGFNESPLFSGSNLVRSLSLSYIQGTGGLSLLSEALETGYKRLADESVISETLPPVSFDYTSFEFNEQWTSFEKESLGDVPGTLSSSEWLDLYGEGIPGLLSDCNGTWYYKSNLGEGKLSHPIPVGERPYPGSMAGLLNIEGDGTLALVEHTGTLAGASLLDSSGKFQSRCPFKSVPQLNWNLPNVRFMDLDGDGRSEIIVDEGDRLRIYISEGLSGYKEAIYRYFRKPGEKPRLISKVPTEAVFAADMTGDGLLDIVRVRYSQVCFWPNLGDGNFGEVINMNHAPLLCGMDEFIPENLLFADLDGSGTTDLLYRKGNQVSYYRNCSGLYFEDAFTFYTPSGAGSRLQFADVLGTGCNCLVHDSPLVTDRLPAYLDVQKSVRPNILKSYCNGLGSRIDIEYTPSTFYYLKDKASGRKWKTKLPYVVQCMSSVTTEDLVTGWKKTESYTYHDGCHDSNFREFRGFGFVEYREWERGSDGEANQGVRETRLSFYLGLTSEKPLLEYEGSLTTRQWEEGARSLKGLPKHREVVSLDDNENVSIVHSVTEWVYKSKLLHLARIAGDRFRNGSCWLSLLILENTSVQENSSECPRESAIYTLDYDHYGRPLLTAAVSYGRTGERPSNLPDIVWNEQIKSRVLFTENAYTADAVSDTGSYRMGLQKRVAAYEITGFTSADLENAITLQTLFANSTPLARFDPVVQGVKRRLISLEEIVFYNDTLTEPRMDDSCGILGLFYERYGLAFELGEVYFIYGSSITETDLIMAGYVLRENAYYRRSGHYIYPLNAEDHFYKPSGVVDAFGNETQIFYDSKDWLVTSVHDALSNTVTAENDYRYLAPKMITDANGNRTAIDYTPLGFVSKLALMGKENASEGDTLESPTEEYIYDFNCFETDGIPIHVRTRRREIHGDAATRWQESVEYTDGLGRLALSKVQAEPGLYKTIEDGVVVEKDSGSASRWVGTGRTIYNNAGNPIKQYEPYFSGTDAYESEPAIVETGVTPILHYDPLDRLIRTDYPDGTYSQVEFSAWDQKSFDQNDTVLDSDWYADRGSPDPTGNEPNNPETRAAWLAAKHASTATEMHLDALGRPFYSIADNGVQGSYATHTELDILGNPLSVTDARGHVVMSTVYNALSVPCKTESMDAGERKTLQAVDGLPVLGFDSRSHRLRNEYDALRRPTNQWLSENSSTEILIGKTIYGESATSPETHNLRGKLWKSYDQSGLVVNTSYDFKGNLLESTRQFTQVYNATIDWNIAEPDTLLESETFTTITAYDALNRAISIKTPHNANIPASEVLPSYNEASLLERVDVKLRGAITSTNFVNNIDYNAKGQRERIQYGNASTTGYTYDEKTFRLKRLLTTRNNGADTLQDLNYTYDPVGNITQIDDNAQQTIYFNGSVVSPSQKFEYDALYRLTKATGREHVSINAGSEPEAEGYNQAQISPQDGSAMRNYTREWQYDSVGNILSLIHNANGNAWTRSYDYASDSNRVNSTTVGQTTVNYTYNAHGSMTSMPHLQGMQWDFAERLCHIIRATTEAYYNYDGGGIRTRKVVEKNGIVETRLYLGGFEIWRKSVNGVLETERETLHVMDDSTRVAVVETLTVDNSSAVANPVPVQRYQLDNHLGSASLELDETANVVSYEEYYPYGDTSYQAGRSASEVSQKRYRYTGKEKDEESGLYYHGARYYACWLGRWTASDPAGLVDGVNLYMYVRGNPVRLSDPSGMFKVDYSNTEDSDKVQGVIEKGDTLSSISKSMGVSVDDLLSLNPQVKDKDKIFAGDKLAFGKKADFDVTEDFLSRLEVAGKEMSEFGSKKDWFLAPWNVPDDALYGKITSSLDRLTTSEVKEVLGEEDVDELKRTPFKFAHFKDMVKTGGPWDVKNAEDGYKKFQKTGVVIADKHYPVDVTGNVMYGYAGAASGFSERILKKMAGLAQKHSDKEKYGEPKYTAKSNWDDPRDQQQIRAGVALHELSKQRKVDRDLIGKLFDIYKVK